MRTTALVVLVLGCIALAPCRAVTSASAAETEQVSAADTQQLAALLERIVVHVVQALSSPVVDASSSHHTNATVHAAPLLLPHPYTGRSSPSFESLHGTTSSNHTNTTRHHLVRVRVRHRAPPHPPRPPHEHTHTHTTRPAHTWLGSMAPLWQSLRRLAGADDEVITVSAMQRSAEDEVPEAVSSVAKANTAVNLRNLDPYDVFWSAVFALPATFNFIITFVDRLVADAMIDLYDV